MRKGVKIAVIVVVVLLVVLMLGQKLLLAPIVKTSVTTVGPGIIGAPIELKDCDFRLLRGHVGLEGLVVRSPEGFKADSVFDLGKVVLDLEPSSLLSDKIHIKRIYIKDPHITYEQSLTGGNNIGKILDNLGGEVPKAAKPEEKKPAEAKAAKKVVIDDVTIEGGKIKVALTVAGGKGIAVPLPTIHLTDIGKEKGGASATEAVHVIMVAVLKGVTSAVGSVAEIGVDGAKAAVGAAEATGKAATEAAKGVGEGAGKALKGLGGLLGGGEKKK